MSAERLRVGDRVGRYEVLFPLASGGQGEVWIGRLLAGHGFEKYFVLKFILPEGAHNVVERAMFLDEARLAARVAHPNVAQVFDLGESNGLLYLVMERVEGESLARLVRGLGVAQTSAAVPLAVSLRVLADICDGLHSAHEAKDSEGGHLGLVHRDVSPQNIMVSLSGHAKLIDFGLAKAKVRLSADSSQPTLKGKLRYISPEQARAEPDVDRRTDIWSVGVVLFRLITGNMPIDGDTEAAALYRLTSLQQPLRLPPGSPPLLDDIVARTLTPARGERFATALELKQALELALAELAPGSSHEAVAAFFGPALVEIALAQSQALATAEATLVGRDRADELAGSVAITGVATAAADRGKIQKRHLAALAVLVAASVVVIALVQWVKVGAGSHGTPLTGPARAVSVSEMGGLAMAASGGSSSTAAPKPTQAPAPASTITGGSRSPDARVRVKKAAPAPRSTSVISPRALDNPYKSP